VNTASSSATAERDRVGIGIAAVDAGGDRRYTARYAHRAARHNRPNKNAARMQHAIVSPPVAAS
jgi:hypothetical protein